MNRDFNQLVSVAAMTAVATMGPVAVAGAANADPQTLVQSDQHVSIYAGGTEGVTVLGEAQEAAGDVVCELDYPKTAAKVYSLISPNVEYVKPFADRREDFAIKISTCSAAGKVIAERTVEVNVKPVKDAKVTEGSVAGEVTVKNSNANTMAFFVDGPGSNDHVYRIGAHDSRTIPDGSGGHYTASVGRDQRAPAGSGKLIGS